MALERHYTAKELCELLGVNAETIRRHALDGRLRSVRLGGTGDRRFPESAVEEWLENRRDAPARSGRVVSIDRRRRA